MKKTLFVSVGMLSFRLGFCTAPAARAAEPVRFDHVVRNDFFAGFSGNAEALKRGMEKTAQVLSAEPNNAEALVWHGAGLFYQSGQAFQSGDNQKGMEMWGKGLGMMDQAVALAPDAIGVRIPRGAAMMQTSHFGPPAQQKELLSRAVSDYQRAYDLQKDGIATMATHPKGELLIGLADGLERTGEAEKSKEFLRQLVNEMPDTPYGRNAEKWLAGEKVGPRQRGCLGCHTGN